jgi:hypothetical protein
MDKIVRLAEYSDADSLGSKLRRRRSKLFADLIETASAECGPVRIIDLGGTETYWNIYDPEFLSRHVNRILLVNRVPEVTRNGDLFDFRAGDVSSIDWLENNSFDIVHSNSVIEHLGDWQNMGQFANEVKRLARRYYVQTPYFWFPIEPHFIAPFFHWLPEPTRAGILTRIPLGMGGKSPDLDSAIQRVQSVRLLNGSQFRHLFDDASHVSEKFLGLTKSLIAIRS